MAIPVARVHLAMAHAALPALLPTPPKSKMLPLLPTPQCVRLVILPAVSPPKPASHADADERWDARKNNAAKSPPSKPCRADAVERWDAHKTAKPAASPASSGSPGQGLRAPGGKSTGSSGRASSSCERWDSKKKSAASSTSSSSSSSSASRASSAGRWDAHKKPRPPPADGTEDDDGQSSTGSNESMELDMPYAGPGFLVAAPKPSMLPMPSAFMVRVAA